jgi:hypothetical protein
MSHGPALEVSDSVADILRAAYYYGLVDGHAVIDPALVLVAAARNDKTLARPVLGEALAEARPLLAAAASAASPEPAGEAAGVPALSEARWWVLRGNEGEAGTPAATPRWDAEVAESLRRAADEAGAGLVGRAAFLLGLLRSPHPAVQSLAGTAGLDIAATATALREQRPTSPEEPFTPLTGLLTVAGVTEQRYPLLIRWAPPLIRRFTTGRERRGPVITIMETEILRQAVITGHPSVLTAHIPLAIVSMQEQLAAIGSDLAKQYRQHNQGGPVLIQRGFGLRAAQHAVEGLPHADDVLTPADAARRLISTGKPSDPAWSSAAATAMERAAAVARRRQHRDIGTTHLLAALLEEPDPAASSLLRSLGIDAVSLHRDLDQRLSTTP